MLGERERGGKEKTEGPSGGTPSTSSSSFLAAFPKAQYDRDVAFKVLPLSFIFVLMIVSNQLTLKYVEVSFYNVARYGGDGQGVGGAYYFGEAISFMLGP